MNAERGKSVADTSFDEAMGSFKDFLSGQGLSTDLAWVFREDVIFQRERIFIKTPVSPENETRAKACYELGQKRDFGISIEAFCLLESRPCCYIVLPEDDNDAMRMLIPKVAVKYLVLTDMTKAEPVSNLIKWRMLKLLNRKSHIGGFHEYIPSKHTLLPEYWVMHAG
jgi:hypothetical protein